MARNEEPSEGVKKALRFSKAIVVMMFVLLIAYVVTILAVFIITGNEPVTLTENLFGFFSAEGGFLAVIKVAEGIAEKVCRKKSCPQPEAEIKEVTEYDY